MVEILLIVVIVGTLLLSVFISPKIKVYVGIPLGALGLIYFWFFSSANLILQLGFTIVVLHGAYSNYKKLNSNTVHGSSNPT